MELKTDGKESKSKSTFLIFARHWIFKYLNMLAALFRNGTVMPVPESEAHFGTGKGCLLHILSSSVSLITDQPVG